jgi:hypothetical protein
MLVQDYHSMLRNTPEQRISHQYRSGSLKSQIHTGSHGIMSEKIVLEETDSHKDMAWLSDVSQFVDA